jgi:hypothetical protein
MCLWMGVESLVGEDDVVWFILLYESMTHMGTGLWFAFSSFFVMNERGRIDSSMVRV